MDAPPLSGTMSRRRTPRGVRGLKFVLFLYIAGRPGRTPRGVRGLKSSVGLDVVHHCGRTPRGVRGLKFSLRRRLHPRAAVAPLAGCVD